MVFKAIREDAFYILTDHLIDTLAKQRIDNILEGNNPAVPEIPQNIKDMLSSSP